MKTTRRNFLRAGAAGLLVFALPTRLGLGDQDSRPSMLEEALRVAGSNASELKKALNHFTDRDKQTAMQFLVAETPRRMHRKHPNDYSWDLAHHDYTEIIDATVITARELIDNVELSFKSRDMFPWAKDLYANDKSLFFKGVLPYRLGTASLDQLGDVDAHWRAFFLDKEVYRKMQQKHGLTVDFEDVHARLNSFSDSYRKARGLKERNRILTDIVDYFEVDFFHKQGFRYFPRGPEEKTIDVFCTPETHNGVLCRGGRCTDCDNMLRHALMSIGIPTSSIRYTAWPHVDSNHETMRVLLRDDSFETSAITHKVLGRPFEFESGVVSTVLEEIWGERDTMSELVWNLGPGETLPWYMGFYPRTRSTRNVTSRYGPTGTIKLNNVAPGSLLYVGVFNNDSDTQLGTATVSVTRANSRGEAIFDELGRAKDRDLVYLPYTYTELEGHKEYAQAVDRPVLLQKDGGMRKLGLEKDGKMVRASATNLELEPNRDYELLTFGNTEWTGRGSVHTDTQGHADLHLSDSALYIISKGPSVYSRPFMVNKGVIQKL